MTKQEQIEEIKEAVIASAIVANAKIDSSCAVNLTGFAEHMYKIGYRKIPENAVVQTKEEYERLKYLEKYHITCEDVYEYVESARKETAKEILDKVLQAFPCDKNYTSISRCYIKRIAIKYDVEVEEK